MALSSSQYATLKLTLRALLSGNTFSSAPNLGESALLSFWNQLSAEASASGVALSAALDQSLDFVFRSRLSSSILRVPDADWLSFFTTLGTDSGGAAALPAGQYEELKRQLRAVMSAYSFGSGVVSNETLLGYLKTRVFNGDFSTLFTPGSVYRSVQTDLGMLYGSTMKDTGGTGPVLTLSGTISGASVPIWVKATAGGALGVWTYAIYYDGVGVVAAMTGTSAASVVLTGAGAGLTLNIAAGTATLNNIWKATCSQLTDRTINLSHFAQATAGKQPIVTLGLNSCCGVITDNSDDIMSTGALNIPAPGTTALFIGMVLKYLSAPASGRVICSNETGGAQGQTLYSPAGSNPLQMYGGAGGPSASYAGTYEAMDMLFTSSTSDYIKRGSNAPVTGVSSGNLASTLGASFGGDINAPSATSLVEVFHIIYVAGYQPSAIAAWRGAIATKYAGLVDT